MVEYLSDGKLADVYDMAKQDMLVCIISSNVRITRQRLKAMLPDDGHHVVAYDLFTFPEVSTGIVKLIDKQLWDMYNSNFINTLENTHIVYKVYEKEEE